MFVLVFLLVLVHVYFCLYMCMCTCACACIFVLVHVYLCVCTCACACIFVVVLLHVCLCLFICTCHFKHPTSRFRKLFSLQIRDLYRQQQDFAKSKFLFPYLLKYLVCKPVSLYVKIPVYLRIGRFRRKEFHFPRCLVLELS
jgi:hypothetical protein